MSAFSTDVAAPPPAAPVPPPPPPPPLSRYEQPLTSVIRFLTAVGQTAAPAAGADVTDAFRNKFGQVVLPTDPERLHAYVAQLNTIPGDHLAAVLGGVSAATRQYFHKIVLELSEGMRAAMPEMGEATAVLRLLIIRMLPAVSSTEESQTYGTLSALQDNYALSDRVAQLIRPDEGNPKLQSIAKEAVDVGNAYKGLKGHFDSFVSRMKDLGFDTEDGARDHDIITAWQQKDRIKVIILAVLLGVLFIAVIVLAIVLMKRRGGNGSISGNGSAQGVARMLSTGGVGSSNTVVDVGGGAWAAPPAHAPAVPSLDFGSHQMPYPYEM